VGSRLEEVAAIVRAADVMRRGLHGIRALFSVAGYDIKVKSTVSGGD